MTEPIARRLPASVKWRDREYDIESGIDLLMNVIQDTVATDMERHKALNVLAMLRTHLKGHPCLDQIAKLYDHAHDKHKAAILVCFQGSRDPRGLPVFVRTLDNEQNLKLRVWAAGALAQWNVRRGVAELVSLLESDDPMPKPSRMSYVRDNALKSFRKNNARNGWGFPAEEIRYKLISRTDLDHDQMRALVIAKVKKWWAKNEDRFPGWKPGDPLPEISWPEASKSAQE